MMDFDAGLYKLVSEYYEAGILYGLYSCGDSLPSIPKICAMFHLAPATVRCAFSELEKKGIILPVSEAYCKYLAPARYDDLLTFRSWVKEIKGVRMVIASEVRRGDELLVAGHVVLVSVNPERKVVRMSKELVESCEQFFWSPEDEK